MYNHLILSQVGAGAQDVELFMTFSQACCSLLPWCYGCRDVSRGCTDLLQPQLWFLCCQSLLTLFSEQSCPLTLSTQNRPFAVVRKLWDMICTMRKLYVLSYMLPRTSRVCVCVCVSKGTVVYVTIDPVGHGVLNFIIFLILKFRYFSQPPNPWIPTNFFLLDLRSILQFQE